MAYDLTGKAIQKVELAVTNCGHSSVVKVIMAKQNDINSRFIHAVLHDSRDVINCTGCTVRLNATKPDGTPMVSYGEVTNGDAYVKIPGDLLTDTGRVTCDISISGAYEELNAGIGDSTGITSVDVVRAEFEEMINEGGLYTFIYNGSNWTLNGNTISLSNYGISTVGTAVNNDEIVIEYSNTYTLSTETFYILVQDSNYDAEAEEAITNSSFMDYVRGKLGDLQGDITIIRQHTGVDLYYDQQSNKIYLINEEEQNVGEGIELPASVDGFITETDENGNTYLYLAHNGEIVGDGILLPSGGGGTGGGSSYTVRVINNLGTTVLNAAAGQECSLNFTIAEYYGQEQTNTNAIIAYMVRKPNANSYITVATESLGQGTITKDVSSFLEVGTNSLRVVVTGGESGQTKSTTYTIAVAEIYMTSSFNYARAYNSNFNFLYKCFGKGIYKTVYIKVDGEDYCEPIDVGTSHNVQLSQTIDLSEYGHGSHTLTVYFVTDGGAQSPELNYDIIYYVPGNTSPIIASSFNANTVTYGNDIQLPYVVYTNGSDYTASLIRSIYTFEYVQCTSTDEGALLIIDNNGTPTDVQIRLQDVGMDTVNIGDYVKLERNNFSQSTLTNIVNSQEETWVIQDYPESGQIYIELQAGSTIKTFPVYVNEINTEYNLHPVETRLIASLNTNGRSNSDITKSIWRCFYTSIDNITTTIAAQLSGFDYSSNGWVNDNSNSPTLRHSGVARTTLSLPIFSTNYMDTQNQRIRFAGSPSDSGRTIEIEFNVHDVTDYNAEIIKCYDSGRGTGLVITPRYAYLLANTMSIVEDAEGNITNADAVPVVSFKDGERIRISFVIENVGFYEDGNTNKQMVRIYINGELCKALNYSDNALFGNSSNLVIGNETCITDIYNIRMYDMALEDSQILQNFISDKSSVNTKIELYDENNVLNVGGEVDYYACRRKYPCILVTGTLSGFKGDKTDVGILYTKPADNTDGYVTELDCMEKLNDRYICQSNVQGTSSQRYAKKNYKFTFKNVVGGVAKKTKYKLKGDDSIGESTLCYKADYMSPNHANTFNANYLSTLFEEEVPPQETDSKVQIAIYGYRCLLFQRDTESDTPVFHGDGCLNNDKGNTATFGLENDNDEGNISQCQKWEFLDNSEDICNFRTDKLLEPRGDSIAVKSALESCYPDQGDLEDESLEPDYSHIQILYTWVCQRANYWSANKKHIKTTIDGDGDVLCVIDNSETPTANTIRLQDVSVNEHNEGVITVGDYVLNVETNHTYNGETYTTDYDYKKAIFENEFTSHFNKNHALTYYIALESVALVDNRAKNMFLSCYDTLAENIVFNDENVTSLSDIIAQDGTVDESKIDWENSTFAVWYTSMYDMDSCLGVDNSGYSVVPYDAEWDYTLNDQKIFNGADSYLWEMIETSLSNDIATLYKRLRDTNRTLSYSKLYEAHITNNAEIVCPTIINQDSRFKYIDIWTEGYQRYSDDNISQSLVKTSDYLYLVQGSKKWQTASFLYNRMLMLDSKYVNASFRQDKIEMRIGLSGNTNGSNVALTLTPVTSMYCRAEYGNSGEYLGEKAGAGQSITITPVDGNYGDILLSVYGASNIGNLGDLSSLKPYSIDISAASKLKELMIGSSAEGYSNDRLTALDTSACKLLQKIDIQNTGVANTLNLSNCPLIEEVYANGSHISEVSLPNGGYLKKLYLPNTITTFILRDQTSITDFNMDGADSLQTLVVERCSSSVMTKAAELLRDSSHQLTGGVRLTDVDWEIDTWTANQIITLLDGLGSDDIKGKQINALGSLVDDETLFPVITGDIYVGNTISKSDLTNFDIVKANYPSLKIWSWNVIWKDRNNTTVKEEQVLNGDSATAPSVEITYTDGDNNYRLTGWSASYDNITSDITLTPVYTQEWTVRFLDYNGDVIGEPQAILNGEDATAPTVPNYTDENTLNKYKFNTWNKAYTNITEDTDIAATYNIYWNVTWKGHNDEILKEEEVVDGNAGNPPANPDSYIEDGYEHTFTGWDTAYAEIRIDLTITAEYAILWTVVWQDYDETVLKTEQVINGNAATPPSTADLTRPATTQYKYTYSGWSTSYTVITQDKTIVAHYTESAQAYPVQFYDDNTLTNQLSSTTGNFNGTASYSGAELTPPVGQFFTSWKDNYNNSFSTNTINLSSDNCRIDSEGNPIAIRLYPLFAAPIPTLPSESKTTSTLTDLELKAISNTIVAFKEAYPTESTGTLNVSSGEGTASVTVTYDATEMSYTILNNTNSTTTIVALNDVRDIAIDGNVMTMKLSGFLVDEDEDGNKVGMSFTSQDLYLNTTKVHYSNSHAISNYTLAGTQVTENLATYTYTHESSDTSIVLSAVGETRLKQIKVTDTSGNIVWYNLDGTSGTTDETNTYYSMTTSNSVALGNSVIWNGLTLNGTLGQLLRTGAFLLLDAGATISIPVTQGCTVLVTAYTSYNNGGYEFSTLRTFLNNDITTKLPSILQNIIVPVKKGSTIGGTSTNVRYMYDKVWALSRTEVGLSTSSPYTLEGTAYPVYTDATSRIKKYNNGTGSTTYWWLRSPYYSSDNSFYYVYSSGNNHCNDANNSNGVAFGFAL